MTQRYEVQTKFIYGFENVWRDEDGKDTTIEIVRIEQKHITEKKSLSFGGQKQLKV